jgi:hypothetical protein
MILPCMFSLAVASGKGIVDLLESMGLQGFPLFLAAVGVSVLILGASYLIATWRLNARKSKS